MITLIVGLGFVENWWWPTSADRGVSTSPMVAAQIDVMLMLCFALQHSVMARESFKKVITRVVSPVVERSTYVLMASLSLLVMFWQWRPIGPTLWDVQSPVAYWTLTSISLAGFALVIYGSFLIDHFYLFGLKQVWLNFRGQPMQQAPFNTPRLYQMVRAPLMLGFLIAFWVSPVMTVGRLIFAFVSTTYVIIGVTLEERDLARLLGETYRHYHARVPMLLPWPRPAAARRQPAAPPPSAPVRETGAPLEEAA